MLNKAVFLDRDGVINIDKHYVHKLEDFEFKPGIFELLKYLKHHSFFLIGVTNQSGIARGYYSLEDYRRVTAYMQEELAKHAVPLDAVYFCPHDEKAECSCRKPEPGMILKGQREYDVDLKSSWLIGDKGTDIEAARRAGVEKAILVLGKEGENYQHIESDYQVHDLKEIMKIMEEQHEVH